MEVFASSKGFGDFREFIEEVIKRGFTGIELNSSHINETNLSILNSKKKSIRVVSINGDLKNYKYQLFTAEALAVDFISFEISTPEEVDKLRKIVKEAEKLGITVAIENSGKSKFYNSPLNIEMTINKIGDKNIGFVLNTANAYMNDIFLVQFTKNLNKKILGLKVSDAIGQIGGLPIGMGDTKYLDSIIKEYKGTNIPWIINLQDHYNLLDVRISKENLTQREKKLRII